jgi:antitoxin component YwqK of YwqJK toxin-antitoxin module
MLYKQNGKHLYKPKNKKAYEFSGVAYSFLDNSSSGLYDEKFSFRNGLLDGPYISFYDNEHGTVKAKGFYLNGEKDGTFIFYDKDGKILEKAVFRNGEIIK